MMKETHERASERVAVIWNSIQLMEGEVDFEDQERERRGMDENWLDDSDDEIELRFGLLYTHTNQHRG